MSMGASELAALRASHPAWRLLRADSAPLVAGFLHRIFVVPNRREIAESDLVEYLEDELYRLRETSRADGDRSLVTGERSAAAYLTDWASPDKGWLRKYYVAESDEPRYDLTPSTEKAIGWMSTLVERRFVGTESRLRTLIELLRQMTEGTEADPEERIVQLRNRRAVIDAEIASIEAGNLPMLDDLALRDRFEQFNQLARELLSDFREVEHNFRQLDREARERIALWEGSKGELLAEIMGDRDAITDTDQGRNFAAFWDFLMSSGLQEDLADMLDHVLDLAPIAKLGPDPRTRRVHHDWLDAGEHAQRTVAQLSKQLRRFLDDKAWLENRRIMEILHGIEGKAVALRDEPFEGFAMEIELPEAELSLAMERPLASANASVRLADIVIDDEDLDDVDLSALYNQRYVDKAALARNIRDALRDRSQVSLAEVCALHPLEQGLAELVAYLELAEADEAASIDEEATEQLGWQPELEPELEVRPPRLATIPRVLFVRK